MRGGRLAKLPVEALFFFLLEEEGAVLFFLFEGAGATVVCLPEGRTAEEVLAAWRAEWRVLPMSEDGIVKK
jgi:hypothetical protein